MNIWPWSHIRELEVRINQLTEANKNLNRRLEQWEISARFDLDKIKTNITIINRGLGRIIAKLDPAYHTDEQDPARKAESDRIGDAVIARLIAESKASNPTSDA